MGEVEADVLHTHDDTLAGEGLGQLHAGMGFCGPHHTDGGVHGDAVGSAGLDTLHCMVDREGGKGAQGNGDHMEASERGQHAAPVLGEGAGVGIPHAHQGAQLPPVIAGGSPQGGAVVGEGHAYIAREFAVVGRLRHGLHGANEQKGKDDGSGLHGQEVLCCLGQGV